MPNINREVDAYYKVVKDKFPQLTEAEFHSIINNTFNYFRRKMRDELVDVRLKGFGSFQIFAAPVLKEMKTLRLKLTKFADTNTVNQIENFNRKLKRLENYVEKNPTLFEEYYERRKKST